MQVDALINVLVERSGKSANRISADLGKSREYVRNASRKSTPSIATVADIADACDIDICLIDRETGAVVATVTPPRRVQEG